MAERYGKTPPPLRHAHQPSGRRLEAKHFDQLRHHPDRALVVELVGGDLDHLFPAIAEPSADCTVPFGGLRITV